MPSSSAHWQIVFLVLTLIGALIPLLMANPDNMVRTDGTKVASPQHPSWKTSIVGLWTTLRDDPMILLLFPMFFASNWFYTWRMAPSSPSLTIALTPCPPLYRIQRL